MVRVHWEGFRTVRAYCFLLSCLQHNTHFVFASSLAPSRHPLSDVQGFYGSALDLRQSQSFCGSILDLRRLGRTTKRVEKREAGELSCCSSLARSDFSPTPSLSLSLSLSLFLPPNLSRSLSLSISLALPLSLLRRPRVEPPGISEDLAKR